MNCMIDSNIILDVMLEREPFYRTSGKVLELCEKKKIHGFVTASTITDFFYITRKATGSVDKACAVIEKTLEIVKVLPVTNEDINRALMIKAKDFEDCLLAVCAKNNHCDAIVTRNSNDFRNFGISLLTPEEAVQSVYISVS